MKFIFLICSLFFSSAGFAISEENYESEFQKKILPLIDSMKDGFFKGENNLKIHYASYTTNPVTNRCLVILPGRTEPLEKYAEVVHSLEEKLPGRFVYFLMDHRGQGSSERMLTNNGDYDKGHVDHFDNYVLDLKSFMSNIVGAHKCSETFLLAHSLGAGIATRFMLLHPEVFDRAAFSSPMLKVQTKPYKYYLARAIITAQMALGKGDEFSVGQKAFNPKAMFEENNFTTSPARFAMAMNIFNTIIPEARLGGVTNGWLNQVMKGTKKIRKQYSELTIPLRVFNAGIENYSESSEMVKMCEEAPYCVRTFLPTAKHEVLMDQDKNRDLVIAELVSFFK